MRKSYCMARTCALALMELGAGTASAQGFPIKPLRIVTSETGGSNDFAARIIAQGLTANANWQVIVENRASVLTAPMVSKAPADGYTLLLTGGNFYIGPLLRSTPYDVVRDFAPVTLVDRAPSVLIVHPSLPVKSVKELIALAKARPGELNYSSGTTGTSGHLTAELFRSMTGVNIVRIPYKSGGPALTDLIAGQVQFMFATTASVTPYIKSGRVRALAVTSAEPSALFPELPTMAAAGLRGYESVSMTGMFAPAKTSAVIINQLSHEVARVLNQADVKERFRASGVEAVGSSPDELGAKIRSEMNRMEKVIKDAAIKADQ